MPEKAVLSWLIAAFSNILYEIYSRNKLPSNKLFMVNGNVIRVVYAGGSARIMVRS